jgi:hypothetical protein
MFDNKFLHRLFAAPLVIGALLLLSAGCSSDKDKGDAGEDTDAGDSDVLQDDAGETPVDAPDGQDPAPDDIPTEGEADVNLDIPGEDVPPPPPSEVLLYDGDGLQFTYEDSGFHALIEPGDPIPAADWLDPVDYYNGEFQIRYVINGPSDQAAGILQTCIWTLGDDGDGRDYFPESCGSFIYNDGPGEYLNSSEPDTLAPSTWWKNEDVPLDFSRPERFLIRVVLRDASGCNVTQYDVSGSCWDEWPSYENMNFRVTIVMVGAGETFSGWSNYP